MLYDEHKKASDEMGETNDCSVKALAVICDLTYEVAHAAMAAIGRSFRKGQRPEKAIEAQGWELWRLMSIKSKTIRTLERELAASYGGLKVLIYCSKGRHVLAWDGKMIADWSGGRQQRVCLNRVYLCYTDPEDIRKIGPGNSVPVPQRKELRGRKGHTRTAVSISCQELDIYDREYSSVAAAYKGLGFHLRGHQKLRRILKANDEVRGYALYRNDQVSPWRNVRIEMKVF